VGTPYFTQEFKDSAVKQVVEGGYPPKEVADRLGVSAKSIYNWVRQRNKVPSQGHHTETIETLREDVKKLKAELKRTQEERDILKKAAAYFARASE